MSIRISKISLSFLLFFTVSFSFAQAPKKYNAAEIELMLNKLNVVATALYVAAHPDDENTRFIAYLANEKLYRTAYLSATRGDGGQNLIGPEIRELLGVIRTQELLAARRTDGGQQFFSRANDFGYSKNPEETFNIWDRDLVLEDFVRTFRKFKPDLVITRFPGDGRGRHGHHTASAILAKEAFEISGDESVYPELAKEFGTWQPKRVIFNTHPFFFGGLENMDSTKYFTEDLGLYNPLLGKSYPEISALSRSMHKSQGFGATGSRGSQIEYFSLTVGEKINRSIFEGIDASWGRLDNGEQVAEHVENAIAKFQPSNPSMIVSDLIMAYKALENINSDHWKNIKQAEIKEIIKACMGLYMEVKSDNFAYTPGDSINLSVEAINRSAIPASLTSLSISPLESFTLNQNLNENTPFNLDKRLVLPNDIAFSQPYWLRSESSLGMYNVNDAGNIGKPENDPSLISTFTVTIHGVNLDYSTAVIFKKNDPVDGEVYRPLEITPPVFANITEKVFVFGSMESKKVEVIVKSGKDNIQGTLGLQVPDGWSYSPESAEFSLESKGEEKTLTFSVSPPKKQSVGNLSAVVTYNGKEYKQGITEIDYDHIPVQTLFPNNDAKIVKIDLNKRGNQIGYLMGAGDEIPASLRQIGYDVWEMEDDDVTDENLENLDALIVGIRAYNTRERMKFHQKKLMNYVNQGGTMIVQYNTAHRLKTEDLGPYPLKLSRDRVAVEDAEVRILQKDHSILNYPNKITEKDFDGWVQERGLYFPDDWDENYQAILSSNDPGEDPKDGGLLVAKYGKGYYIYSGYSWFRELPAGVPGAYRIFTNMISIGKAQGSDNKKASAKTSR